MTVDRVYTVGEADALLPELRERLERIREARQTLIRGARVIQELVVEEGGGVHPGPGYLEATDALRKELEHLAREEIVLRDAQTGLVDFPAERDGERVWLCWLPTEERVGHWHPLDMGFAGRRPI